MTDEEITLEYRGRIAIITLNRPQTLNALTHDHYFRLARCCTSLPPSPATLTPRAPTQRRRRPRRARPGALARHRPPPLRPQLLGGLAGPNPHTTRAFHAHPTALAAALNGPAGGTRANEALLRSRRVPVGELVGAGCVNGVFDAGGQGESGRFVDLVLREVEERLGPHLNQESVLAIKALIKAPEMDILDRQGVKEVFAGLDRFLKGVPQEEFMKIASGEKKHKL
ncbi:hypothetical protein BDY21DRAFT_416772 [Lineolata rhizophorae]|uniref:ClpP/crotonase-like domain-containing protein n=1 Tax=Lineolata rhizophorae TaxID=578093 RepID=A0A6A6NSG6_9PEZI|nr:hypothetical protein BDY21DRAFT_416772 [Lineolata rhizophorae]